MPEPAESLYSLEAQVDENRSVIADNTDLSDLKSNGNRNQHWTILGDGCALVQGGKGSLSTEAPPN